MLAKYTLTRTILTVALFGMITGLVSSCASTETRQSFRFVQMCDTQLGMSGYDNDLRKFRLAVDQVNALRPDFVVICGDLVGRPKKHTFDEFNEVKALFTIPCHCVPGNHDVGNTPTLETLAYYRKSVGKDYYSFNHKGYAFICVNSQLWKAPVTGESEAHDLWLRAALKSAAKQGRPVFIVAHYPLYLKTPDEKEGYYNLPLKKRQELLELFEASGVVAVLTGHTHKIIINDHNGMQMVSGETTSRTHGSPLGFRIWTIDQNRPYVHASVPLNDPESKEKKR